MRSSYPFLIYGSLGAIILSALRYIPADVFTPLFSNSVPAAGTGSNAISPLGCFLLVAYLITPALMGLLAARATGFAFYGGATGAASYVGYGLATALLDPVLLHFPATTWDAGAMFLLGCQGIVGFVCGVLGGLVGRGFYEEPAPSYAPSSWAPEPYTSHGSYEPGVYPGAPLPPSGPYGAPPVYRADAGPAPYAPPQYQPPPRYQPGAAPVPPTYPARGYDQSAYGYGLPPHPAPGDAGAPWNAGWPPSGAGDDANEDDTGGPWQGWNAPGR